MTKMDWFQLWHEDKEAMISTMARNMAADLENGYNYFGNCIQNQIKTIEEYKAKFNADMDKLAEMDEKKANRWCYMQLLKAGAITA